MLRYLELFAESPTDGEDNLMANREIPALDALRSVAGKRVRITGIAGYCATAEAGWLHIRLDGETVTSLCTELLQAVTGGPLPLDIEVPAGSEATVYYHPNMGGSPDDYSVILQYEES